MQIKEITSFLESIAPSQYQESYDNSGLIIGKYNTEVKSVLISVDVTEDVVQEAIEKNANLIIAHHPIIFGGIKRLNSKNYVERVVELAIKNDIAIYSIHTNFDNVIDGTNSYLANELGLEDVEILKPNKELLRKIVVFCPESHADEIRNAIFNAGAGKIGEYDNCSFNSKGTGSFRAGENTNAFVGEKGKLHFENEVKIESVYPIHLESNILSEMIKIHPYEEVAYDIYPLKNYYNKIGSGVVGKLKNAENELDFLIRLKKITGTGVIKHTKLLGKKIEKVALCGGSGAFLINDAKYSGADIYITGDVKYHEFFDAENNLIIADIGHYESEQFTKDILFNLITENFSKFAVLKSEINTNPIKYL